MSEGTEMNGWDGDCRGYRVWGSDGERIVELVMGNVYNGNERSVLIEDGLGASECE
jgi:hypothetical protein